MLKDTNSIAFSIVGVAAGIYCLYLVESMQALAFINGIYLQFENITV
jgi:hypothetical protein